MPHDRLCLSMWTGRILRCDRHWHAVIVFSVCCRQCSRCTFINKGHLTRCGMCDYQPSRAVGLWVWTWLSFVLRITSLSFLFARLLVTPGDALAGEEREKTETRGLSWLCGAFFARLVSVHSHHNVVVTTTASSSRLGLQQLHIYQSAFNCECPHLLAFYFVDSSMTFPT